MCDEELCNHLVTCRYIHMHTHAHTHTHTHTHMDTHAQTWTHAHTCKTRLTIVMQFYN